MIEQVKLDKEKKKVGRPLLYSTPEELEAKVDEYFTSGRKVRTVVLKDGTAIEVPIVTITGLVLYLGFCDRYSFYEYEKKPEFTYTIKRARSRIEQEYEEMLQRGLGAGAIFALKNFGWIDKTEHEHSGELSIKDLVSDVENRQRKTARLALN